MNAVETIAPIEVTTTINNVVDVVNGEKTFVEAAQDLAESVAPQPFVEAVNNTKDVVNGDKAFGEGVLQVAGSVAGPANPALVIEQLQDTEKVSGTVDSFIDDATNDAWSAGKTLIDSTNLTNIDARQNAAVKSFQKGDIGSGLYNAFAMNPALNPIINQVESAAGFTNGPYGHTDPIQAPSAKAIVKVGDAVADAYTKGSYSAIRDLSDSTGLTDIKNQQIEVINKIYAGDVFGALGHFGRSTPFQNILFRVGEKGFVNYFAGLTAPDKKLVTNYLVGKAIGKMGMSKNVKRVSKWGEPAEIMSHLKETLGDAYDDGIKQVGELFTGKKSIGESLKDAGESIGEEVRKLDFDNGIYQASDLDSKNQYLEPSSPIEIDADQLGTQLVEPRAQSLEPLTKASNNAVAHAADVVTSDLSPLIESQLSQNSVRSAYLDEDFTVHQGSDANEPIQGYLGNDLIDASSGDELVHGGKGRDIITGGEGADEHYGAFGWNTYTPEIYGSNDLIAIKSDQMLHNGVYVKTGSNNANGEKLDITEGLDANDQIKIVGVETGQLSFAHAMAHGMHGIGIFGNGALEALYTGGNLSIEQLHSMTTADASAAVMGNQVWSHLKPQANPELS